MLSSRVPLYTSGRQKRAVHVFSEIFKQRFLKITRTPHFFAVLSSTFVHFGTLKTHGCTHSQKYLVLRFLKIRHKPRTFLPSSRVPSYTSGRQKRTVHVFSDIFKQRFLKIIRTPHAFIVLSSTLVHFGTLKTHGCTHSRKYLAKVSKDNTHPALFCCPLEYPCKMCSRRQRKLR